MAACMTLSGTPGLAMSVEVHSKAQMQNRVGHLEHKTRQADGSLMTTNVTLTEESSPVVAWTTRDLGIATLNAIDKTALTAFVVTQPAVGLGVGMTKLVCTFADGVVVKGDLVGGDAPDSEAEQQFFFVSTTGPGAWAEAA